ncbi:hypothetical protein FF38_00294 [Lucilia cuprina]|uniref:Uncharacterized protein n=1 Tax=Lucilia cuprina TaxID=7375 RepID=A0A0L0BLJ9_LUCCU|nr:hypothetical protein FF38_00294 [Lucilia cuprina]
MDLDFHKLMHIFVYQPSHKYLVDHQFHSMLQLLVPLVTMTVSNFTVICILYPVKNIHFNDACWFIKSVQIEYDEFFLVAFPFLRKYQPNVVFNKIPINLRTFFHILDKKKFFYMWVFKGVRIVSNNGQMFSMICKWAVDYGDNKTFNKEFLELNPGTIL